MKYIIWFILIAIALHFINKFLSRYKFPKVGAMALFTGGIKAGKSTCAVGTALSEYRRRRRYCAIRNWFNKIFKKPLQEEPLIYSNIPLSVPYVELTEDLILRRKRFRYGSVIYVNEASLFADSMLIRDMELNERLTLFNKLIGHELKGGCIIYDTQCIVDNHFSIKRSLSNYFYVHHLTKGFPFFLVAHIRECLYSDDSTSLVNAVTKDAEMDLRKVIIPKSTWKKFDAYAFSSLTDDLPVEDKVVVADSLKVKKIVSFREFKTLPKEFVKRGDTYEK